MDHCIEGSTGYNFQINIVFLSLKIVVVFANSEDPDEMTHLRVSILGWTIVYRGVNRLLFPKIIVFLSLKIVFVFANSEDSDEMPQNVAFNLGSTVCAKLPIYRRSK